MDDHWANDGVINTKSILEKRLGTEAVFAVSQLFV